MGKSARRRDDIEALSAVPIDTARTWPAESFFNRYTPIRSISLLPIEDLRTFHPSFSSRPVKVISGVNIQPLRVAKSIRKSGLRGLSPHLRFAVPGKTIICIRRKRRREVLFARRQFGGAGGRRRRNQWSDIRC